MPVVLSLASAEFIFAKCVLPPPAARLSSHTPMEQRFTDVYRTGEWSKYPLSGRGSTLEHTAQVRKNLTDIITSLFDKKNDLTNTFAKR